MYWKDNNCGDKAKKTWERNEFKDQRENGKQTTNLQRYNENCIMWRRNYKRIENSISQKEEKLLVDLLIQLKSVVVQS